MAVPSSSASSRGRSRAASASPSGLEGLFGYVIFGAALVGVLVVVHLWLQQRADFAFGCSGTADLGAAGADSGCAEVTGSAYATFLGVNNVVWGLLFYGLVAALRFAYAVTADARFRLASFAVVGVGALYAARLVFLQVVEIGAFCALCMTSAALVALLLALHVMEHLRARGAAATGSLRPYAVMAALVAVLAAGDVVYSQSQQQAAPPLAEQPAPVAAPGTDPGAAPLTPSVGACTYDPLIAPIDSLERFTDVWPFRGNADAPVTVIEIFDPNCPHCKDMKETLAQVMPGQVEKARFYYVPFALREASFGQVAALYYAQEEGRFFEMADALFARQDNNWGASLDEVVDAAREAGLNPEVTRQKLTDSAEVQRYLARIMADRELIQGAFGTADGRISVPKVAVNGRVVAATTQSYSAPCFNTFINDAHAAAASTGEADVAPAPAPAAEQ